MRDSYSKSGFSLVELSIVLVILGLLVGGILGGRSLIRAAELRNIPLEYQKWQTAVFAFQQKYHAKPGDMRNATRFWGNAETGSTGGECDTGQLTAYTDGKQTCNGNGDGLVQMNERYRFWQHLANAGLIEGQYTGIQGSGGAHHHEIGKNTPASRISGVGWSLRHASSPSAHHWSAADTMHQTAYLGGQTAVDVPYGAAFRTDELWSIDQKLDDGKPGTGLMRTRNWQYCSTVNDMNEYDSAEYALDYTGSCTPLFYGMY